MQEVPIYPADGAEWRELVTKAHELLMRGDLVVLPTDTGYALCGRAMDEAVLERVYRTKVRDPSKPLHVLVADLDMARRLVVLETRVERLLTKLLPGPLTVVLPALLGRARGLNRLGSTIGIRMPEEPFTLDVLRSLGEPLTATSANVSGAPPPFESTDLVECRRLDGVAAIFDAGRSRHAIPSTIVEIAAGGTPVLLREGPLSLDRILQRFGDMEGRDRVGPSAGRHESD